MNLPLVQPYCEQLSNSPAGPESDKSGQVVDIGWAYLTTHPALFRRHNGEKEEASTHQLHLPGTRSVYAHPSPLSPPDTRGVRDKKKRGAHKVLSCFGTNAPPCGGKLPSRSIAGTQSFKRASLGRRGGKACITFARVGRERRVRRARKHQLTRLIRRVTTGHPLRPLPQSLVNAERQEAAS